MGTCWGDISENVRVEVPNTDCSLPTKVFWIAGIVKLAGESTHNNLPENASYVFVTCKKAYL